MEDAEMSYVQLLGPLIIPPYVSYYWATQVSSTLGGGATCIPPYQIQNTLNLVLILGKHYLIEMTYYDYGEFMETTAY